VAETRQPQAEPAKSASKAEAAHESAQEAKSAPAGGLLPAAEASDPTVHRLLAERQAHMSTASIALDPTVEENKKVALKQVDEIDKQLADLGYTAK
jgi:hypothetical protein